LKEHVQVAVQQDQ